MTAIYKILFSISSYSNLLPIIPLLFLYNKLNKAFRIYLIVLIIGASIDLLGFAKIYSGFHFNYMLIIDIYEVINYVLILSFFYFLNNRKYLNRYVIIFLIGLTVQSIDWLYITKFKYNSIYAEVFYYMVCCYLCFDRINYQIIHSKKMLFKIDWLLIFFITICVYYSYAIFTLTLYCLNIPLNIKIDVSLYYILNIVNTLVNITLTYVITKLPSKLENRIIY